MGASALCCCLGRAPPAPLPIFSLQPEPPYYDDLPDLVSSDGGGNDDHTHTSMPALVTSDDGSESEDSIFELVHIMDIEPNPRFARFGRRAPVCVAYWPFSPPRWFYSEFYNDAVFD